MSISLFTAKTGLIQTQEALDITANNIANASTSGFKPLRASFSDLIYTVRNSKNENEDTGHGAKIDKTDLMFGVGALMHTGQALDFAIPSEGLFSLQKADGTVVYTKDGSFQIQQNGDVWNLIDSSGSKVLDAAGDPVLAQMNEDGTIDTAQLTEDIGVFTFENPYGLITNGNNYYLATESSGAATADTTLEKKNGYLEASGANLSDQMVKLIQFQKAFSFNAKMVQTADQLESIINNLR